MLFLDVLNKIVFSPAGVATQLTTEWFLIRVYVHVISQPLLVSILVTAYLTLVRLDVLVRSLVSRHGRGSVSAEATGSTHEWSLIGVFESHVFVQSRLLNCCIVTRRTTKPRT